MNQTDIISQTKPLNYHIKNIEVFFNLSESDIMLLKSYVKGVHGKMIIDISGTSLKYKQQLITNDYLVSIDDVTNKACEVLQTSKELLMSKSRANRLPEKRALIYKIANKEFKHTKLRIGKYFSRDHSTVISGINKINDLIDVDKNMKDTYHILYEAIKTEFSVMYE